MIAHLDLESRSTIDLLKTGVDIYAKHPTTDVWCMYWALDDLEPTLWVPGMPFPKLLLTTLAEQDTLLYAHNAAFEKNMWDKLLVPRYGFPKIKESRWRCTMAMGYAMALPGSLEKLAAALGLAAQKDIKGSRLMKQMAKPRSIEDDGTIIWWDDDERKQRLFDYCKQDVEVERAVCGRVLGLTKTEQSVWLMDLQINERGVPIDRPSIEKAIAIVKDETKRLNGMMHKATGGVVSACTFTGQLKDWLNWAGVDCKGVGKDVVVDLLADPDVPEHCKKALRIRQEAGKSSTAKLQTMLDAESDDGRVRGTMQYHGAGTGRWSGRRIQPHNYPRPKFKQAEIEDIIAHLDDPSYIDMIYGNFMDLMPSCLRGVIKAKPGNELIAMDYKSIEGRVLAWLAGEEWVLQAYLDGLDMYKVAAASVLNKKYEDITDLERQMIGKVCELACGYQGSVGAIRQFGGGEGLSDDEVKAKFVTPWRAKRPKIEQFWYSLERAALKAFHTGKKVKCGPVTYLRKGSFLWCKLPSGRVLCYPYPEIRTIDTPWGVPKDALSYMKTVDQNTRKSDKILPDKNSHGNWQRVATYGGKLAENVTQAVARDILAEGMTRLDDLGFNIIFHVHDEAVLDEKAGSVKLETIEAIMIELPIWAKGLPLAADGWKGIRYRK